MSKKITAKERIAAVREQQAGGSITAKLAAKLLSSALTPIDGPSTTIAPPPSATGGGKHRFNGATAAQLMESILTLVPYDVVAAARIDFQTAIQLAILDAKETSETPADWDGWIRFESDCVVNGESVKAGTSWGPFAKSTETTRSERGLRPAEGHCLLQVPQQTPENPSPCAMAGHCIGVLPSAPSAIEQRPCTCDPADYPPVPCAKKYALAQCREATKGSAKPFVHGSLNCNHSWTGKGEAPASWWCCGVKVYRSYEDYCDD